MRSANALKTLFDGLQQEFVKSVEDGRADKWADAAHAIIDFIAGQYIDDGKSAQPQIKTLGSLESPSPEPPPCGGLASPVLLIAPTQWRTNG